MDVAEDSNQKLDPQDLLGTAAWAFKGGISILALSLENLFSGFLTQIRLKPVYSATKTS